MSYTKSDAIKIIGCYNALREWVLEIVSDVPYMSSVETDDCPDINIKDDKVVVTWKRYESDYYGGGRLENEHMSFPVAALLLDHEKLKAMRKQVKAEEAERLRKVRAAERAVEKDRQDARDRAEFVRLTNKFKHGIEGPEAK